ncbi:MAG TPA: hypothetical protein VNO14_06340 [Blastocatellia bacterium]|nr:hypothetical protein [Blastocatellia bacterium]
MKRRIIIETEVERLIVIRGHDSLVAWCGLCADQTVMIRPDHAARLCRITSRAIYRMVEAGLLHFIETTDGLIFICRNSLPLNPTVIDDKPQAPAEDAEEQLTPAPPRSFQVFDES